MRLPWRCVALLPLVAVAGLVACDTSGADGDGRSDTLLTFAPASVQTGVVCGQLPGAWQTYVVTLTDVTDPADPFVYPSSVPVPCSMPVSFSFVVPGHLYTAAVDAYDTSNIEPLGGVASGSRHMIDVQSGQRVEPRWTSSCGVAEPDPTPTQSVEFRNILVTDCEPLVLVAEPLPSSISIDLTAVQAGIGCGTDPGQIERMRVTPSDPAIEPQPVPCGQSATFSPVTPQQTYDFLVEAFSSGDAAARWASHCTAVARDGVTVPASCTPLTTFGSVQVALSPWLEGSGHQCSAEDLVTYEAAVLGTTLAANEVPCESPVQFDSLQPGLVQIVLDAQNAAGQTVLSGYCEATVTPAATTQASCTLN